jgi:hypothetical protein
VVEGHHLDIGSFLSEDSALKQMVNGINSDLDLDSFVDSRTQAGCPYSAPSLAAVTSAYFPIIFNSFRPDS